MKKNPFGKLLVPHPRIHFHFDISNNLVLLLAQEIGHSYTQYDIQYHMMFHVTMVTFWMTLLMSNQTNVLSWMMHKFVHRPTPYLLLSPTCDETLSQMTEIQLKNHLVKSHSNCQHYRPIIPPKKLRGMSNQCWVNN